MEEKLEFLPEIEKRMLQLKKELDSFRKEVLKRFDKYVIGIELVPAEKEKKDQIDIFVLIDDSDSQKIPKYELRDKVAKSIEEISEKIDKKIKPKTMILTELKENLFDGKYEILTSIGAGAIVYDRGMLGALKTSEIHKNMAIEKFEKYVLSYVACGSLFRGDANPKDIDVYVVIDDTDVKKMPRIELKDKLRLIIQDMGFVASKEAGMKDIIFHVQTYILTDFWDAVKEANPVIYTFLRDGVPLFDRGVFMPWKLLLQMGRIKPSPEAIDMNMDIGERLLQRSKNKLLSIIGEDLYYAALNPAQAALMLYGIPPPTPKESIKLLEEIFVKKEKLLEKKYVDFIEKLRKYYKDFEQGKVMQVTGKQIDDLLKEMGDYLKRIRKLFQQIERKSSKENILNIYDTCLAISRDALFLSGVKNISITKITSLFKQHLVEKGLIPEKFLRTLKLVIQNKKDYEKKKLAKQEVDKATKEARIFIRAMADFIQRQKIIEIERSKIRFRHGNKYGEVLLLEDVAFIIEDIKNKDQIKKANFQKGRILDIKESSPNEVEEAIGKVEKPKPVFINKDTLEDLKKAIGKDTEILINY